MGLDGYFFVKELGDTKFDLRRPLCGGIFSGDGSDGSFRAKCYQGILIDLTGYDLVTHYTNEEVRKIANILRNVYENDKDKIKEALSENHMSEEEFLAFLDLFEQAAEKGCQYVPWY